ncbi:phage protease [Chitiniphilus eburneus]|uniref:phage protease n=1 Tax=Chitiniphilus eburneus TaxID=2571148 RepID=UPI0035D0D305
MPQHIHIAALTLELPRTGGPFKLLPAGTFRAGDGRPLECTAWVLDARNAAALIAAAAARTARYVIDYEHQTLHAPVNGQPAPASGWFQRLEWREGDGLWVIDPQWTARAAAMLDADEYRYISPVFTYDRNGRVLRLLHVALTNNPALDQLPGLTAALSAVAIPTEDPMDELIEQLRWLLNLPVGATADDIKAQLQKLIAQLSEGQGTAAASVDLVALVGELRQRVAALSANPVDLSRYAPVSAMRALQEQVAALTANAQQRELDELVAVGLDTGRLLPAQEQWARDLGKGNLAALRAYLPTVTPIAALTTTQTGGTAPTGTVTTGLDGDALAICNMFGNDPAVISAALKE